MNKSDIRNQIYARFFDDPGAAIGNGGWMLHGNHMRTRQRPDGSDGGRTEQMAVKRFADGGIYIGYNGASFQGGTLWTYFARTWDMADDADIAERLAGIYGIPFDRVAWTKEGPATYHGGKLADESTIITIPASIPAATFGPRQNVLQTSLESWIDPVILAGAFYEYGVGTTKDGRTIFWQFDQRGRCRTGKIIRYGIDGHRDKNENPFFAHSLLTGTQKFPKDWKPVQSVYGEHLLTIHADKPIAVVESEKTAIIATCFWPELVWLATGGKGNTGRVLALLEGRAATFWPDADATKEWQTIFARPEWKVMDLRAQFPEYGAKFDIADLLEGQHRRGGIR